MGYQGGAQTSGVAVGVEAGASSVYTDTKMTGTYAGTDM